MPEYESTNKHGLLKIIVNKGHEASRTLMW